MISTMRVFFSTCSSPGGPPRGRIKFFKNYEGLGTLLENIKLLINLNIMEDAISLHLIEPHESNQMYRDAQQSYKEIYNNIMARGKGNLEPKFLGGNPIQLDPNNMGSLFKFDEEGNIIYNDYYISTKANGLRFMLLIGNKDPITKIINIYLIDSRMNFWYIKQMDRLPPIPVELNIDKCLIDGELLFWGSVTTRIVNKQIKEYTIKKDHKSTRPLIAFLAFDILYGPTKPDYSFIQGEKELSHLTTFKLGSHGPMIGFKSIGRWPTSKRREVLHDLILNPNSPLWNFLHVSSAWNLHSLVMTRKGDKSSIIEGITWNFTILVSPFIKMRDLFEEERVDNIYSKCKTIFINSLKDQHFLINLKKEKVYLDFPDTPIKIYEGRGKGLSTDGLIFTPQYDNYLIGSWSFCNNKQYKWKPVKDLTIDFSVGDIVNGTVDESFYYYAQVRKRHQTVTFEYGINDIYYTAIIGSSRQLLKNSIMECVFSNLVTDDNQNLIIFQIVQERLDKSEPNAYLTAVSVLNANGIRGELDFLKNYYKEKGILELMNFIKNNGLNTDVLKTFSLEKLRKCCFKMNPINIFSENVGDIVDMIIQKQNNSSYELELRIDFTNSNYSYSNCLINNFIESDYVPVPVIKIYNKDIKSLRSVYALLGEDPDPSTLIHEETIDKIPIKSLEIVDEDVYHYKYNIELSNEVKSDSIVKYGSDSAGNTEYQVRYTITNVSKYWRIDIIEYGNSKDIKMSKHMQEQKTRTRVEIEYAPASYVDDLLKWENPVILNNALNHLGIVNIYSREVLLGKLQAYKNKLNARDPYEILEDLAKVLIKIFNVLDMDLGNIYDKEVKTQVQKSNVQESNVQKSNVQKSNVQKSKGREPSKGKTSIFERMRKFHNFIKSELIGEVAALIPGKTKSLLDISVGKGGDIQKWNHADIDVVYGIDPDKESIVEAKGRYENLVRDGKVLPQRKYTFENIRITDKDVKFPAKWDIVSCQFTLHYFFKDISMLRDVIEKVSNSLKAGGYFIGTTLLGSKVKELIKNNKYPNEIKIMEIDKNSYRMELLDTANIYHNDLSEYYVDFNLFKKICVENSMELEESKLFIEIYNNEYKNKNKKDQLKDYELAISSLNTTFIFKKIN